LKSDYSAFAPLVERADADIEALLADYDLKDRATLISILSAKLATQELKGQTADGLQTIRRLRELQEKPDLKLTTGLFDEANGFPGRHKPCREAVCHRSVVDT
jgi:hypothetical protein